MDTFDKFLTQKLKKDKIDVDINNSSFNYLQHMVSLNAAKTDINRNSMFSFISDFFSPRFLIPKIAFVSILFILVIGNKENKQRDSFILHADSTIVDKNSYDTISGYGNSIGDTLYR